MTRLTSAAIAALVLLRLVAGWHFYNEGVKKLDPTFTSAGFLRTAKGPLAPLFRGMVTGPYGAYAELAAPTEQGARDAAEQKAIDSWLADYARRAAADIKGGKPAPADLPAPLPGSKLLSTIDTAWTAGLVRLGVGGETGEELQKLREARLGDVVLYLHSNHNALEELRHEAWRLEGVRAKAAGPSPAPYLADRLAAKEAEVWRLLQPHTKEISAIDAAFRNDVQKASGLSAARVEGALRERSLLSWIDAAVACTVVGSGVCLFLGLATPVAAVVAAGFLLSLIMTQPPWLPGADLTAFFNWAVELCGMLVLATVGAGRWAGLDGLFLRLTRGLRAPAPAAKPTPSSAAA